VASERQEGLVPGDLIALAAGDRGAQVVVDALADDAAEPVEDPDMAWPSRKLPAAKAKLKCAVCAPE